MKGKTKRKFTADFKLKVVLEVLKEKDTLAVISKRHDRAGGPNPSQSDQRLEEAVHGFNFDSIRGCS